MTLKEALEKIYPDKSYKDAQKQIHNLFEKYGLNEKHFKKDNCDDSKYDLDDKDVDFLKFLRDINGKDPGSRSNSADKNFNIEVYDEIVDLIENSANDYPLIHDIINESVHTYEYASITSIQKLASKIVKIFILAPNNKFADYSIYSELNQTLDGFLYTYACHEQYGKFTNNIQGNNGIINSHFNNDNKLMAYKSRNVMNEELHHNSISNIGCYQGVKPYVQKLLSLLKEETSEEKLDLTFKDFPNKASLTYQFDDVYTFCNFVERYYILIINLKKLETILSHGSEIFDQAFYTVYNIKELYSGHCFLIGDYFDSMAHLNNQNIRILLKDIAMYNNYINDKYSENENQQLIEYIQDNIESNDTYKQYLDIGVSVYSLAEEETCRLFGLILDNSTAIDATTLKQLQTCKDCLDNWFECAVSSENEFLTDWRMWLNSYVTNLEFRDYASYSVDEINLASELLSLLLDYNALLNCWSTPDSENDYGTMLLEYKGFKMNFSDFKEFGVNINNQHDIDSFITKLRECFKNVERNISNLNSSELYMDISQAVGKYIRNNFDNQK
jgi:hypothetical protein